MKLKFTKMHGCGNDYVYVNGFTEKIEEEKKPEIVRRLSDRHFGIGGDGVIFINPAPKCTSGRTPEPEDASAGAVEAAAGDNEAADFEMEMYNADGTRAEMCGNGIRCVAKYVYDKGLTDQTSIRVVSCGKMKYLDLTVEDDAVVRVKVNMGAPVLKASDIPVIAENPDGEVISDHIMVKDKEYKMTCVSMGNPHAVVFLEEGEALDPSRFDIGAIGPYFENHKRFPKRTNTEFVKVIDNRTVEMRVWERGTGETLACGTGACAVAVACVLNGLTQERVTVKLLGGELDIYWDREKNLVFMTGPAAMVFDGEIVL